MRVIIPVVPAATLQSSSVSEPDAGWPAYSAGTTYTDGARVTSGGQTYQSRQINNLGNPLPVAPELSTDWWDTVTETAYNAATTYALGDRVISTSSHRRYESLQAGNLGKPLPVPPETQTAWWLEIGVTNRFACVDTARNTQTIAASPYTLVIKPGQRVNAIAVMGMEADSLTITMTNAGATVYNKTFDLRLRRVKNGYEYAFKPFDLQPSVVQFDLPPFSDSTITLTLARTTGIVKLGSVVVGNYIFLGDAQQSASNDALNFSTIERDIYGTATLVPRRTLPKVDCRLIAPKVIVADLLDARTRLNAVPAVYSGLDDRGSHEYFEPMLVLGIYKQFAITLINAEHAEVSLEIEEI